jgi:release factor glutamine methyltransferase
VSADVSFLGLRLATHPGRVMTPRPATEQLVASALEVIGDRAVKVADVGTGSGAIAVAIAAAAPRAEVWATDTSPYAVVLATLNARRHVVDDRVFVRHGDLLDPVPGSLDLIVANLPYLPATAASQFADMAGEPPEAVFAAGDGLEPYRRLLTVARERLTAHGAVVFQLHRRVVRATRTDLTAIPSDEPPGLHLTLALHVDEPQSLGRELVAQQLPGRTRDLDLVRGPV